MALRDQSLIITPCYHVMMEEGKESRGEGTMSGQERKDLASGGENKEQAFPVEVVVCH